MRSVWNRKKCGAGGARTRELDLCAIHKGVYVHIFLCATIFCWVVLSLARDCALLPPSACLFCVCFVTALVITIITTPSSFAGSLAVVPSSSNEYIMLAAPRRDARCRLHNKESIRCRRIRHPVRPHAARCCLLCLPFYSLFMCVCVYILKHLK